MLKIIKNKGWKPVKLEGPIVANDLEGLVGIEELKDYNFTSVQQTSKTKTKKRKISDTQLDDKVNKNTRTAKNKKQKKGESKPTETEEDTETVVCHEPGTFVRNPKSVTKTGKQKKGQKGQKNKQTSETDENVKGTFEDSQAKPKLIAKSGKRKKGQKVKKQKTEIGQANETDESNKCAVEDLQAWSIVALPEPLLQGLADLGFTKPTPIQELTLPAAIFGRRDILGAAETGSGKTLAFGLPILTGILKHKEELALNDTKKLTTEIDEDSEQQNVEDSEQENIEDSEQENIEDSEQENIEDSEQENDDLEQENDEDSDQESIDDSDQENIDGLEKENIDLEQENDEDSEQEIIDDSEQENIDDSEQENIDDSDQENIDDSEQEIDEDSEQENDENSDLSDFEEKEENVENETINGIGCVRSINNVQFEEKDPNETYLKPLYALILTPTRELAVQVKNHLMAVAKHTDIKIAIVLGGMAAVKQERVLNKCPEIVVATPGRLWELIQGGNPHLSQIDNIKYLAIDETDRMIEKYHFQELHHLLERINLDEAKRKQRQTFVFSATLTMVHDLPRYLAKKKKLKHSSKIHKLSSDEKIKNIIDMIGITDPKIVDVTKENSGTAKSLVECRINCELEEKDFYVYYFLQKHPGRTLIFCNSIGCVKRLANLLTILGCASLPLHATMQQRQRLKNLERFRDNLQGVLVATDVAARGLDIPSVEHVLHYQTPRTSESYVHRSGRTARASKEGITILLIEPNEVNSYVKMCNTLGRTEDLPHFPIMENMLAAVKQRVKLARKLEKLELQTKRTNSETGWLQKAANEMDIILDENEFYLDDDKEEKANARRQVNAARQELKSLLAKPIFPKGFSVNYPTSSGQIDIPMVQGDQTVQKAVDVMKNQIQNGAKNKNNLKKLYKKKPVNDYDTQVVVKNVNKNFKNKNKNKKKNK